MHGIVKGRELVPPAADIAGVAIPLPVEFQP